MPFHKPTAVACCAAFAGAGALALFGFGPLDPPDGPIAPTYKTLSEVEARTAINSTNTPGDADSRFKITKPGSYYLTGNITGVSGKSGIEVTADCTIDLGGFEVGGVNGSLDGIVLVGEFHGTVRNGRVSRWGQSGIAAQACYSASFEDLLVMDNKKEGLWLGRYSVVSRVRALRNGAYGIRVEVGGTVADCTTAENTLSGIFSGSYTGVSRCNAASNGEHGISSIEGGNISDCVAEGNTSAGIRSGGGIIRDSVCDGNFGQGVLLLGSGGTIVRNNTCAVNALDGVYCQSKYNRVEANTLRANSRYGFYFPDAGYNLGVGNFVVHNFMDGYVGSDNSQGNPLFKPYTITESSWSNIVDP